MPPLACCSSFPLVYRGWLRYVCIGDSELLRLLRFERQSNMQQNPYSDESFDNQPTEIQPAPAPAWEPAQPGGRGDPQYPIDSLPTEANPVPPPVRRPPVQPVQPVQPGSEGYPQYAQSSPPFQQNSAYRARERAVHERERAYTATFVIGKIIDFIGWILLVLEVALALRFLLKVIGADPANPFASFLYNLTGIFLFPFKGIVPNPTFGPNGVAVFEVSTLLAMVIYGVIFVLLKLLLRTAISRPGEPVA